MIIPYRKHKDPEGNLVQLPIISVRVACNKIALPLWALVDSGADLTLLNASLARVFNVDLKKGTRISLAGVMESQEFIGYLHQANLAIKDVGSVDTVVALRSPKNTLE